jgi:hypothetical protein
VKRCLLAAILLALFGLSSCLPYIPGEVVPPLVLPAHANQPPIIAQPRVYPDDPILTPRAKYLFDFNFAAGSSATYGRGCGVYDMDGDAWRIVEVTMQCTYRRYPETIYRPWYVEGVYHAVYNDRLIENAFLVFPLTAYESAGVLPYAPMPLAGYEYDAARRRDVFLGIIFSGPQGATLTVTVEDEHGAQATGEFYYMVAPLEAATQSAHERRDRLIENNREIEDGCWAAQLASGRELK